MTREMEQQKGSKWSKMYSLNRIIDFEAKSVPLTVFFFKDFKVSK